MFNWSKERIGVSGVLKNLVKSHRNGSDSKLGEGINLVKHWQRQATSAYTKGVFSKKIST